MDQLWTTTLTHLAAKTSYNQTLQKIFRPHFGHQRYSDQPIRMSDILASLPGTNTIPPNSCETSNLPDLCSMSASPKNLFTSNTASSESLVQEIKDFSDSIMNKHESIKKISVEISPTKKWKVINVNIVIPKKMQKWDDDVIDENGNKAKETDSFELSHTSEVLHEDSHETCSLMNVSDMSVNSLDNYLDISDNDSFKNSVLKINLDTSSISKSVDVITSSIITETSLITEEEPSFRKFTTSLEEQIQSTPLGNPNENYVETSVERARPLMGQRSLPLSTKLPKNDVEASKEEKIVHELVMDKFKETLKKYRNRSINRQLNRSRNTVRGYFESDVCEQQKSENNIFIEGMSINETNDYENQNKDDSRTSQTKFVGLTEKGQVVRRNKLEDEQSEDHSLLSRRCTCDSRDCTPESQDLTYDSQEFLRNALGDEYENYFTTESRSGVDLNETRPTIAESIGTSNISELISRDSAFYDTVNNHWVQMNINVQQQHQRTEQQQQLQQEHKEILDDLMQQSQLHFQTMVQASKAVHLCESSKAFISSLEHIEAERLLLLSTRRREKVVEEMTKVDYTTIAGYINSGSVSLSNLLFFGRKFESNKRVTRWFVCIVGCGKKILATKAVNANNDGNVVFEDVFEFKSLSSDFEIDISLYGMLRKTNERKCSRESTFHLNKNSKRLCLNPKNIFKLNRPSHATLPMNYIRTSSFVLYGKAIARINDLHRTNFRMFNLSSHGHHLCGTFRASFNSLVNLSESFCGFLNVGRETSDGIIWNRLWCLLEGKLIKCFSYPDDSEAERNPVEVLELDHCAAGVVKASRSICARPRTLLLEVFNQQVTEIVSVNRFLSAESVAEMKAWEEKINSVVSALKSWKCMKVICD